MTVNWRKSIYFIFIALFSIYLAGCAGGIVGDNASSEPNSTGDSIDLKVATLWPGSHPQNTEVVQSFLDEVEEATEGRVKGTIYPLDALGEADALYDLAVTGVADMALMLHGSTPGEFPLTSVSELPFMGEDAVDGTRILWNIHEQFPEIAEEHNDTVIAWLFKNDSAQILTTNKQIKSWEDLEGMRIRTPSPAGTALLEAYGAIPVSLTMGEVYEAMQRGVVDGALAPASVINNFQLGDVTKYVTKGNFYTSSILSVINENIWNKISEEDQKIIEELMGERMAIKAAEVYDQDSESGWQTIEEKGIEVYELSEEEIEEWTVPLESIYSDWIEEMDSKGLPGTEVFEAAIELRDQGE